jgi:glycosyltransferase involved in cell wall biosynthesis
MNTRQTIAIAHPMIGFAGSESVVAYALREFQEDYEPVLVTGGPVDIDKLNQVYGASIDPERVRQLYPWYHFLLERMNAGAALRGMLFGRFLRKAAGAYPLCVSAYNFMDFGKPAVQCIADFSWDEEIRQHYDATPSPGVRGFFHRYSILRRSYLGCVRLIGGGRKRGIPPNPQDQVIANSRWTAEILREKYGIEASTVYPPVQAEFPEVAWEQKEAGFVCIGRISPEKRVERMIEILSEVRRQGEDVHLHVIGGAENVYGETIKALARKVGDWVIVEGKQYGAEKERLLAVHRFGIHACQIEAFGIGVVEMLKAGCMVFAPDDGGQAEVLDHPDLLYGNVEDAATKIVRVLRDGKLQQALLEHLTKQSALFSAEDFCREIRREVEAFQSRLGSEQSK